MSYVDPLLLLQVQPSLFYHFILLSSLPRLQHEGWKTCTCKACLTACASLNVSPTFTGTKGPHAEPKPCQPRSSAASRCSFRRQSLVPAVSAVTVLVGGVLQLWPGSRRSEEGEDVFLAALDFISGFS